MAEKIAKGISVVIPLYQCYESLNELHQRLIKVISDLVENYEIIYVNDGSTDGTTDWLAEHKYEKFIKVIQLSRNFGQHPAIFAGLNSVRYEFVCVMDGDLQDRPEEVETLFRYIASNNSVDYVVGQRKLRSDNKIKIYLSYCFYKTLSYLTETNINFSIANFGIYRYKVINEVLKMGDYNLFFPVMVQWVGFKGAQLEIKHDSRKYGKSNYNFQKLLKLGISVIISFSNKPIFLIIKFGMFLSLLSLFAIIIVIIFKTIYGTSMPGWASLIVASLFFGAIQISLIGIIGLYVSSTFDRVKSRQKYIIDEENKIF